MSDLSDYFSDKDRIKELEAEVDNLKTKLKSILTQKNNALSCNRLYKRLLGITYKPSLKEKAILMIKKRGATGFSLREIASKVGLSYSRIKVFSMYINRGEM